MPYSERFRTTHRCLSLCALMLLAATSSASAQSLTITDLVISEADVGTQNARLFVTLTGGGMFPVTVDFLTEDGSAIGGEDYLPAAGTLIFPDPGMPVQEILVPIVGDLDVEPDETFSVLLANAVNAGIMDGDAIVTILNDDQPLDASIDDAVVTEGDAGIVSAVFDVRLTAPAQVPVNLGYTTRDGSATAGVDYRTTTGAVTIQPGEITTTIAIDVFGDTLFEGDETFEVEIFSAGVTFDDAEGTILDDDDEPTLAIGGAGVLEGDAGTTDAVFNVTLSGGASGPVTVSYATRDGSATATSGDYLSTTGMLTFAAGETMKTVTVEVTGDTLVETDETFFVDLSQPDGATITDGQGEGTILNDDLEPPSARIDDVSMVEGDNGLVDAVFTVELSRAASGTLSVDFTTQDGTATAADEDYRPEFGTLTFAPGQIRRQLTVGVIGDTRVEDDEVFSVQLSNPVGVTIADGQGEGTILNDDLEPSRIRFADVPPVDESAGTVTVSLERFGGSDRAARVTVSAASGTATAGEDFTVVSRDISWDARETGRKVFEVAILDDSLEEDNETVVLRLSNPVDALVAGPAQLSLVIVDDDTPMELDTVSDATVSASAREEIELQVRATRDDGAPVEGATVVWAAEGDAELVDGERTPTDGEGLATQRLQLGSRAGEVVVTASIEGADRGVEFTVTVESNLADAVDPVRDPGGAAVAQALDRSCASATGEFGDLCGYLTSLESSAEQAAAIAELAPEEVAAQAGVALGAQRTQLANIGSRLAALRGGATSQAVDQLAIMMYGQPVDLGGIRSAWASRHQDNREKLTKAVDSALAVALAGGLAAADDDDPAMPSGAPRWGIFVNGRISLGDRPTTARETGFDFETLGLTAGADYRFSDRFVLGGALGYLDNGTELDLDGGKLDARGTTLSAYGSYTRRAFYVDGVLSYGRSTYDLTRNIDLPQPFQGRQRFTALGSPDGSQISASLGAGYDTQLKGASGVTPFTLGGYGSLSWIDSRIDGYNELDAGPFNLAVADQDVESLLSEAGVELAYAASQAWGVLRPTVRLSYLHEFEDDARLIRARFIDDITATSFAIPTEAPDRDFFNLTAGLTATLARGRTIYLIYDTDLDRDDLNVYTFTFGARFEL